MYLHLLTKMIFLIFSILLFVLSVFVLNKAYHQKGQRFAASILFCFGSIYLVESIMYILPIEYAYFLQVWVVQTLSLLGLCLISHYVYFLIKKHSLLTIRFTPYIFYLYFVLFIVVVGAFESVYGKPTYIQRGGWYIRESLLPSFLYFTMILMLILRILFLLSKGLKYAYSEKRKKLYKYYLSGGMGTLVVLIIFNVLISNYTFPLDIAILISLMPFLLIIGIENYLYLPGFAKHYNKIIELSPTALFVLNRDFKIVEINKRAKQWFKMEKGDQLLQGLQSDKNIQEIMELLTDLQTMKEVEDYRVTLIFEKETHFSISASIVELEDEYYYYIMLRDITNEFEQEKKNYYLAYHDALTTLYNRTYFTSYVCEKLKEFNSSKKGAIILSDLNFFKKINDTYGHHVGDEVLIHTGKLISSKITEPSIVARLGGDEFIIYCDDVECEMSLKERIEKIRHLFKMTPYVRDGLEIEVIPSFGYALITEDVHYEELYQKADAEMYKDKRRIKVQYTKKRGLKTAT